MPAWIERSGARQPVYPGIVLQESDRVVTGANARIVLTLPEGSRIKLGENAQLAFDSLVARQEGGSVFLKSAINVLTGAFRFTTNALSKVNHRRDINFRLVTVTAGIRGTDFWAKQGGVKEIVCLFEGRVEVERDAIAGQVSAPVVLDQPQQFYIAPKDQPTLPIGRVPDAQMAQWIAETEIARDAGGQSVDGRWMVVFEQATEFNAALSLYEDLRRQGYAAQFKPETRNGRRIYQVQLVNLSSQADAAALASKLGTFGVATTAMQRK